MYVSIQSFLNSQTKGSLKNNLEDNGSVSTACKPKTNYLGIKTKLCSERSLLDLKATSYSTCLIRIYRSNAYRWSAMLW